MELENLLGDGKGKGTSGGTARPKVPMRRSGADCLVVVKKPCNEGGAKGGRLFVLYPKWSTGDGRNRQERQRAAALNE